MALAGFNTFPRVRIQKNREFLDWIARQLCVCGAPGVEHGHEWLVTPSHIRSRGAGGRDVGNVVPMCMKCHHAYGKLGKTLFEKLYKLDLRQLAKGYEKQWLQKRV